MWHIYLLPSSTAFYPVWQFQLPPGSSQSNETFWLKVQVCSIKEAFWGHSGHSGKAGGLVLEPGGAGQEPWNLPINGCLS